LEKGYIFRLIRKHFMGLENGSLMKNSMSFVGKADVLEGLGIKRGVILIVMVIASANGSNVE
jgi:hypothetical protein